MTETIAFLAALEQAAHAAQREEIAFRENVAAEIAKRERARQFAFRRLGLIKAMVTATGGAKEEAEAVARGRAALKAELGWLSDTEARGPIVDAWGTVAQAVWRTLHPETSAEADQERPSVGDALAAFEAWYETAHGSAFLALLDQEIPEMPVVEF